MHDPAIRTLSLRFSQPFKWPGFSSAMELLTTVRGPEALPLFKQLATQTGTTPKWNFYKYLISRDGQTIQSFSSMTGPQDKSFVQAVEKELAAKVTAP